MGSGTGSGIYISYNTGTRALPDIHALALGCCAPSGIVHIYQATHSCLRYNLYIRIFCYKLILQSQSVNYGNT